MIKFKGRIGVTILIFLFILNFFIFKGIGDEEKSSIIAIVFIMSAIDILFLYLTFKNYTTISEEELITVQLGFFKTSIPCDNIKSIKKTYNPLASMSMSFRRLDIVYKGGQVLMSVKDESAFTNELVRRNPRIQVHL